MLGGARPLSRGAWSRRTREAPGRHREVGADGRVERTGGTRHTTRRGGVVQPGRAGRYTFGVDARTGCPRPVRRVEMPQPGGGVRKHGLPTVRDRVLQQALRHVLPPEGDQPCSAGRDGVRLGRSAPLAMARAQADLAAGESGGWPWTWSRAWTACIRTSGCAGARSGERTDAGCTCSTGPCKPEP